MRLDFKPTRTALLRRKDVISKSTIVSNLKESGGVDGSMKYTKSVLISYASFFFFFLYRIQIFSALDSIVNFKFNYLN